MKALVYHGPSTVKWQDWPDPQPPRPGEVRLTVRAVGICGSDLHGYEGRSSRRKAPMVMGHEFTGVVDAVGSPPDEHWLGRRAVVRPFLHCGHCEACLSNRENLCGERRYIGATTDGAMAERIVVPVDNLHAVADHVTDELAALTEPLAVALHAARRASARGRRAVVVGGGTIGLLTLVALQRTGAASVYLVEPQPHRQAVGSALGADGVLADAAQVTGADFDVAVDALGSETTFNATMGLLRPGGTVVALGGWQTVRADLSRLVAREIEVKGSFNFTPRTFAEALAWIEQGTFDAKLLLTRSVPLAQGAQAFDDLARRRSADIKVMLVPEVTA